MLSVKNCESIHAASVRIKLVTNIGLLLTEASDCAREEAKTHAEVAENRN